MSKHIIDEVSEDIKLLIKNITGYDENAEQFNQVYKQMINKLKKSHVIEFTNKREVDKCIRGMAEKYTFHNFPDQAKALQDAYEEYMENSPTSAELSDRLNVVMFLIFQSNRPTTKFLEHPEEYAIKEKKVAEEDIDWGKYLTEDIEIWDPKLDESSECSVSSAEEELDAELVETHTAKAPSIIDTNSNQHVVLDFRIQRAELLNTIQHTWYNQNQFHDAPSSEWREANIGILWDRYVEKQTVFINLPKSNILSEYKVIREIFWQLWETHESAVFKFEADKLKVKSNVTISSMRAETFQMFLEKEILPCIEVLDIFLMFNRSLEVACRDEDTNLVPGTYRSYNSSLQNIIQPVYRKLVDLEDKVREQEQTYTLLMLTQDLRTILEPVFLLEKIHKAVIINFHINSNLECSTTLLSRLHYNIQFAENKLDQDLRLTLYLESLYHYLTMLDSWLVKNQLTDYSGDFLIQNVSSDDKWKLNFGINCDIDSTLDDGVLKIMCNSVLQIGRNLYLLRALGKYLQMNNSDVTIYEEFLEKSLEELRRFFGSDETKSAAKKFAVDDTTSTSDVLNNNLLRLSGFKKSEDCCKVDQIVDITDGFLMEAFEEYFVKSPAKVEPEPKSLLEKISDITKSFFPVAYFFENILNGILNERFAISGLMVKKVLIEEYHLEEQFKFLRHVFLFFDDLIFPFYRRLFEKITTEKSAWGNNIWLTSHLQDILMDIYPVFYERSFIQVDDSWENIEDILHMLDMVTIQYEIKWPLDIIIDSKQMDMYRNLFRYILKIKWALYTLNHLNFEDLEPRGRQLRKTKPITKRDTIKKLKYLKFAMTNLLNSVQHYIFSFVFTKCLQKFQLDFEKAYDLSTIIKSHEDFIQTANSRILDIPEIEELLTCTKDLHYIWNNIDFAIPAKLYDIYKIYTKASDVINPIVCPVYIFDY